MSVRMTTARFEVVCELDLGRFDDARLGQRTARRAHAELRRLARRDWRIDSTRRRRNGRHSVEISVTVAAVTSNDALDHCQALLRTAVHATGGSTQGWEHLCTTVRSATPVGGTKSATLRRPPAPIGAVPAVPAREPLPGLSAVPGWAAATATAQQRGAAPESLPPLLQPPLLQPPLSLPPLSGGPRRVTVIDLRDD